MKKIVLTLFALLLVTGLFAQVRVYTPTQDAPDSNAVNQMPDVTVSWLAIAGSLNLQYQVQIDTVPTFNSPALMDVTQPLVTAYTTQNLIFGQTYYWRVRAIDGSTSAWSYTWNFTVFSQLELSKPSNNANNQEPNVSLEWKSNVANNPVSGVSSFEYQYDTSASFNSPILHTSTVPAGTYVGTTANLLFGNKYYWRVRAHHATDISDWSPVYALNVLDKVTLQSPANNAVNQVLDVVLKWKEVKGVLSYEYEIATDNAFTNKIVISETEELSAPAEFLMFGNQYYWRARARHLADTTTWGDVLSFTTINTVILKTPAQNEENVSTKPTMRWTAQTGIVGFHLQVDESASFTEPYISVTLDPTLTEYILNKNLDPTTTYFWRMRAFSNGGIMADTTDWSAAWGFTTGFAQGIDENKAQIFSIYPNPAKDKVQVKVTSSGSGEGRFVLVDLLGKVVFQQNYDLQNGSNAIDVILSNVNKGIYIARITVNGKTYNQKLIVE